MYIKYNKYSHQKQLYPESRLKELQCLTGIPYQEIKKDIFRLIGDEVKMKSLVGYGFSLPSKPSLFNIGNFDLLGLLFVGRLKPYPTEFYFMRMFVNGVLENSTLQKHYNLTYFSQELFFNVKIIENIKLTPLVSQVNIDI